MSLVPKKLRAWSLATLGVLALTGAGIALAEHQAQSNVPFPMNHKVHIQGKVDCMQCHLGIMDATENRFPDIKTCTGCHKDPPGNNPGKALLASYAASGRVFDWDPPRNLPDHVFFPHDRHVDVANLDCAQCHPEKAQETKPRPSVPATAMKTCISCHEKSKRPAAQEAATDCAACHR